jgi:hypothetical protein
MSRSASKHDPRESWEDDFDSETELEVAPSGVAAEARDFDSEPVAFEQDHFQSPPVAAFQEDSLQFQPTYPEPAPELPSPAVIAKADRGAPRIGRIAGVTFGGSLFLLAAVAATWVIGRGSNIWSSVPGPQASRIPELESPAPIESQPPTPAIDDDDVARAADAATRPPAGPPSGTVQRPETPVVEPPPANKPPPASDPPPVKKPPPLKDPPRREAPVKEPVKEPPPLRGTTVAPKPPVAAGRATASPPERERAAPPPPRAASAEPTPAPPSTSRATSPEPAPPPSRTGPPDPAPAPLPRARVEESTLAPPANPPAAPVTPLAPPAEIGSAAGSPAAATADVEGNAIREILGRYRSAFNSLDAKAAQAVWPAVNPRTLDRAFGQLREQNVSFDKCTIDVKDLIAAASCSGTTRFVPRVGNRTAQVEARQWNFILRKASSGGWQIQEVQAR